MHTNKQENPKGIFFSCRLMTTQFYVLRDEIPDLALALFVMRIPVQPPYLSPSQPPIPPYFLLQ